MTAAKRKLNSQPAPPPSIEPSILERPHVAFGREITGDLPAGLRREWLVTNGLGGYASATVAGVSTRSYHGLLVAALEPPVARTVLVANSVDWVVYDGARYPLSTSEFGDGEISPDGYRYLETFRLEGSLPVWTFAVADALVERRIWMPDGVNATFVTYHLLRGSRPIDLEVTPLVTYRSFHALASGQGWDFGVDAQERGATIRAYEGAAPFWLRSDKAEFRPDGSWWWGFHHRGEAERGLADRGDLFAPGVFLARLDPGATVALIYSTDPEIDLDAASSLAAAKERQQSLLTRAGVANADPVVQQLVLAADQFLVARPLADEPDGRSVIAGYHWFNDWGRDTMISLPGLTLAPVGQRRPPRSCAPSPLVRRWPAAQQFPRQCRRGSRLQHRRRDVVVHPGNSRLRGGNSRRVTRHRPPARIASGRRAPPRGNPLSASASIRPTGCSAPVSPECS